MKIDFKIIKDYWPIGAAIVAFIGACSVFPVRLSNAENKINDIEDQQKLLIQQTTTIGAWVQQEQQAKQFEEERYMTAPPGWKWDPARKEYVAE